MFTFSDNIFIFTVSLTNVTLHLVITYSHLHLVITSTFFPYLITSIISLSSLLPSPDIPLLISFPPNTFLVILSHLSSPLLSTLLYSTLLIGFPPLSSPLLPVLQFFLSKVKLLPLLSAGPPIGDLYVEAGSENFTLPLPSETVVLPGDNLIWKRNGDLVYRRGAKKNEFTVLSPSWALVVPAAALQVVGQVDVYTVEVHNKDGIAKLRRKTTLHLLAGPTRVRDMCFQGRR